MKIIAILISLLSFTTLFSQNFEFQKLISPIHNKPNWACTSDLDGDGFLDLVVTSDKDFKVAWFRNDGMGNFGRQKIISEEIYWFANSVCTADIDSDGDMDVFVTFDFPGDIFWFENDGTGEFSQGNLIDSGLSHPRSINTSDLDEDGDLDLLVVDRDEGTIFWYENEGAGVFGSSNELYNGVSSPYEAIAADFDSDGDMDVVAAHFLELGISYTENLGGGDFVDDEIFLTSPSYGITKLEAVDLDSDGDLDILACWEITNDISWFENDGTGIFAEAQEIDGFAENPKCVHSADLDNDGDLDVISANSGSDTFDWYENEGDGVFADAQLITGSMDGPTFVSSGDFNLDGDTDLALASLAGCQVEAYSNDGSGNFSVSDKISTHANGALEAYAADIDGDGLIDVASVSASNEKIEWYKNYGQGDFDVGIILSEGEYDLHKMKLEDIDGDDDVDILFSSFNEEMVFWLVNDGSGNFGEEQLITEDIGAPLAMDLADLDNDDDVDILFSIFELNELVWIENIGGGTFSSDASTIGEISEAANDVKVADFNQDGLKDIVCCSSSGAWVAWMENEGDQNFGPLQIIADDTEGARSVNVQDYNVDGFLDVAVASLDAEKITWYQNDGYGVFGEEQLINESPNSVRQIYTQDLDADSDPDILAANSNLNQISWYENLGGGIFAPIEVLSINADYIRGLHAGDIDGDGDLDPISASGNDGKIAWYPNIIGNGCTDSEACNYDPEAMQSDGSCCYEDCGCTYPLASNYNESSLCDNGSCVFEISGLVYNDLDANGEYDGDDFGLAFQEVNIEPLGIVVITDDEGLFTVELGYNEQLLSVGFNELFPFNTTEISIIFDPETSFDTNVEFGISADTPIFDISIDLVSGGDGFPCNDWNSYTIGCRNMGNIPIDGIVEFEYDELYQDYGEITPIDSTGENVIYMSFENLLPGEMLFYVVDLLTPSEDNIGDFVTNLIQITGFFEDEVVAYGEEERTLEISCAYDPNDKQAFPIGFTEEHFLLQETEQEFLVRFQNTGNALAQDVLIIDTLDINYDLESFELVANSHSMLTTIYSETRVVEFYFENIQLPDSVNDEPNSHGLVSYKVKPLPELPLGTVLENTAHIYFDNNEPIVTNTTWTTVHECGGESLFETSQDELCLGEEVSFLSEYFWIDSLSWLVDGVEVGDSNELFLTPQSSGMFEIELAVSNSLCMEASTQTIEVYDLPLTEIFIDGTTLTASSGETFQWYYNGEVIEDANDQVYEAEQDGSYYVIVTNENGCSDQSEEILLVHVLNHLQETIKLYPNPIQGVSILEFESSNSKDIRISDSTGRVMKSWEKYQSNILEIRKDDFASGSYLISIDQNGYTQVIQVIVQ